MNYKRVSDLYALLDTELKKTPLDEKRIKEINYYIAKEWGGSPPKPAEGSFWHIFDKFLPLPEGWKLWVTGALSAFVAFNSQMHFVTQDWQNGILAAAVALGFWSVSSTQTANYNRLKDHLTSLSHKKQ